MANQRTTVPGVLDQTWLWGPKKTDLATCCETITSRGQWWWSRNWLVFSVATVSLAPPKSCRPGPEDSSRTPQDRSEGRQQEVQQAPLVNCDLAHPLRSGSVGSCWCQGRPWPVRLSVPEPFDKLRRRNFRRTNRGARWILWPVTESCSRFRVMVGHSYVPLQWSGTGRCKSNWC